MEEVNYKIRVLIVEDEPLIAENLAMYLNNHDFEVAGIAYDYEEGVQQLQKTQPDIALLDINLEGLKDGIDLGAYIFNHIKIPFVFLTSYSDKSTLDRAKKIQPSGFLVKPFHEKSLLTTLEISLTNFAMQSTEHHPPLSIEKINKQLLSPLSEREFEVVQLIYSGKTNQQITQDLFISINTLKRHINNAYMRLDVKSRTEAVNRLKEMMR
jgi:DNA-binding NarL/FixJ family response regulator